MARYEQKGLPWSNGIGSSVKDCITSSEVIHKANLDYTVDKCELFGKMPIDLRNNNFVNDDSNIFVRENNVFAPCDNVYATYRTDYKIPLGVVKSKYTVVQNIDAFRFFDEAIGKDKAKWEYAGMQGVGNKIFVTAKLPKEIKVGKDLVDTYLVFTNSHDGTSSINIMLTPVRVFCTNCLNSAKEQKQAYINIRHTKSVTSNLNMGAQIFKASIELAENSEQLYNYINNIKLNDNEVKQFIAKAILNETEYNAVMNYDNINGFNKLINLNYLTLEASKVSMRKANQIVDIFRYYNEGIGQKEIAGNAWGAYNAITGYYSNVVNMSGEIRMNNLLYGTGSKICNNSFKNALEWA